MQIQAEVGGNLAELLDQVASTMRERSRMRGEVKALTAEGRASALMLVVMVPALGLAMKVLNPTYMEPMFTTSIGRILLGVSAVMIVGGYVWMNSLVKIAVCALRLPGRPLDHRERHLSPRRRPVCLLRPAFGLSVLTTRQ